MESGEAVREKAQHGVEQVEKGDANGTRLIDEAREADPPETEAVEQKASGGPPG